VRDVERSQRRDAGGGGGGGSTRDLRERIWKRGPTTTARGVLIARTASSARSAGSGCSARHPATACEPAPQAARAASPAAVSQVDALCEAPLPSALDALAQPRGASERFGRGSGRGLAAAGPCAKAFIPVVRVFLRHRSPGQAGSS
jgi:hypothetical protein